MTNKMGWLGVPLASVLALLAPTAASARDRDDFRRDYRAHDRFEHRDRVPFRSGVAVIIGRDHHDNAYEQGFKNGYNQGYTSGYQNGYYDQNGKWHSAPQRENGYYNQSGGWISNSVPQAAPYSDRYDNQRPYVTTQPSTQYDDQYRNTRPNNAPQNSGQHNGSFGTGRRN